MKKNNDTQIISFWFESEEDAKQFFEGVSRMSSVTFSRTGRESELFKGERPNHFIVKKSKPIKQTPLRL